ncbi:hypothetical protein BC832DRAFT_550336 [Gaertneriomyces semiglobifer]|nr:hypothetical protein BC832DRAFT_550336 [Gaertneriomyces semiglobifer]
MFHRRSESRDTSTYAPLASLPRSSHSHGSVISRSPTRSPSRQAAHDDAGEALLSQSESLHVDDHDWRVDREQELERNGRPSAATKHNLAQRRGSEALAVVTELYPRAACKIPLIPAQMALQRHEEDKDHMLHVHNDEPGASVPLRSLGATPSWTHRRAQNLPEQEFLTLVLDAASLEEAHELVSLRLSHLLQNDDALKMQRRPFYKVALFRIPAILVTLSLGMLVGGIVSSHDETLRAHILLASFLPILSSVSGNIGLQSSTTTLRALATGYASNTTFEDMWTVMVKELLSAMLIAGMACVSLLAIGGAWSQNWTFAAVTGGSILISSSLGGLLGSGGVMLVHRLGIDPALTAGPFETAVQDIISTSVYLGLAAKFL